MHHGTTDRNATLVRGFAWHIYPDPATPGVFEGDLPFSPGGTPGPGRPPYDPAAPGVVEFWQVSKNAPGIRNEHRDGSTYLAVSEASEPPRVSQGWFVAPAKLDESFQLDQRGSRWVHLVRIASTAQTDAGPALDYEFQIDRA